MIQQLLERGLLKPTAKDLRTQRMSTFGFRVPHDLKVKMDSLIPNRYSNRTEIVVMALREFLREN